MSDKNNTLKDLLIKRSSIKAQIAIFKNYLNSLSTESQLDKFQLNFLNVKIEKFEALSVRFDHLQDDIEVLISPDNLCNEIDERDIIDRDITRNIAIAKVLLEKFTNKIDYDAQHKSCIFNNNSSQSHSKKNNDVIPQNLVHELDESYFTSLTLKNNNMNNSLNTVSEICDIQLNSVNDYVNVSTACIIVNKMPQRTVNNVLSDPEFKKSASSILVGNTFLDLQGNQPISHSTGKPNLNNSRLGWLISGPIGKSVLIHKATFIYRNLISKLSSRTKIEDFGCAINILRWILRYLIILIF